MATPPGLLLPLSFVQNSSAVLRVMMACRNCVQKKPQVNKPLFRSDGDAAYTCLSSDTCRVSVSISVSLSAALSSQHNARGWLRRKLSTAAFHAKESGLCQRRSDPHLGRRTHLCQRSIQTTECLGTFQACICGCFVDDMCLATTHRATHDKPYKSGSHNGKAIAKPPSHT